MRREKRTQRMNGWVTSRQLKKRPRKQRIVCIATYLGYVNTMVGGIASVQPVLIQLFHVSNNDVGIEIPQDFNEEEYQKLIKPLQYVPFWAL